MRRHYSENKKRTIDNSKRAPLGSPHVQPLLSDEGPGGDPRPRRRDAARLVRVRRKPAAGVLRGDLDALEIGSEGQGGRDRERPLCLPDDGAERRRCTDSSEGDAGDPNEARGSRAMAHRTAE